MAGMVPVKVNQDVLMQFALYWFFGVFMLVESN